MIQLYTFHVSLGQNTVFEFFVTVQSLKLANKYFFISRIISLVAEKIFDPFLCMVFSSCSNPLYTSKFRIAVCPTPHGIGLYYEFWVHN